MRAPELLSQFLKFLQHIWKNENAVAIILGWFVGHFGCYSGEPLFILRPPYICKYLINLSYLFTSGLNKMRCGFLNWNGSVGMANISLKFIKPQCSTYVYPHSFLMVGKFPLLFQKLMHHFQLRWYQCWQRNSKA